MRKKQQLVRLEWLDSEVSSGWSDGADFETVKLRRVTSVGWVIAETDDALVLAAHIQLEKDGTLDVVSDAMTIPKVAIVNLRKLREA